MGAGISIGNYFSFCGIEAEKQIGVVLSYQGKGER